MSAMPPRRSSLPAAPEAEAQVVGAVLLDGRSAYEQAAAIMRPEHLSDARYRAIWESFERLHGAGAPIDLVTVMSDLRDHGAGAMVDAALLADLSGGAVNVGALPEHARIVAEAAQRRAVTIAAEEAKQAAARGDLGKASRAARAAVVAAEAPGAKRKRQKLPGGRITRGDDVELAQVLLEDLRAEHGQVVFAEGYFYRYDAEAGIWRPWELSTIGLRVHGFAGTVVAGKPLQMGNGKVLGTLGCARREVEQPDFFHAAPPGIAFANCFLTVEGKAIVARPHAAEHRARAQLPYAYRPGAACPLWLDTLGGVWRDDADLQAKADFLGQFIGACMLGMAWRYERNPVLVGLKAGNGKSTVLRVLQGLFRPEQVAAVSPQDLKHEYSRAKLRGVLLNVVSELPGRELMDTASWKAIVSGDIIGGRNPGEPVIFFKCVAGQLYACNDLPPVADSSGGPWRRFAPLEFNRSFEGDADKEIGLGDRILRTELEGVAAWAIGCAQVLLERGDLELPQSAAARRDAWRHDSDQVLQWAQEELDTDEGGRPVAVELRPGEARQGDYPLASNDLYGLYRKWATMNGHAPLSAVKWASRLEGLGAPRHRFNSGVRWACTLRSRQ